MTGDGTGREHASETDRTDGFVEWLLSGTPGVAFATDEQGRLAWWNDRLATVTGRDPARLDALPAAELFAMDPPDAWDRLGSVVEGEDGVVLPVETADGRTVPHEFGGTARIALGDGAYLYVGRQDPDSEPGSGAKDREPGSEVRDRDPASTDSGDDRREAPDGRARDGVTREPHETRLRDHRDQLARLNRIGDAASAALDPVLEAGSREEIERRVCERLADTDLYEVVWVGRPEGGGSVVPCATRGADPAFHEVAERIVERTDHVRSADRAFRRGEAVVHREGWQREAAEAVREAVDGTDLRATMAVPLAYHGTTYGTLTAYSTREDAFSDAKREALLRLGRAVGFAINAVGTRRLVHAHERTELEFEVGPESSVLAAVSEAVGAECALRWTTPATGPGEDPDPATAADRRPSEGAAAAAGPSPHDLWLRVDVQGADAGAVFAAAEGTVVVEARVVDETGTGCTVELRAPASVPRYVVDAGARPLEVVADGGRATVVAEAPTDADIRSVVEAFTDATGGDLVAKRGGSAAGPGSSPASLTAKQREALRTAAAMGYFDWPREHTAEEVADRLGVASATFHYHLRAAQQTLVRTVLDTPDGSDDPDDSAAPAGSGP